MFNRIDIVHKAFREKGALTQESLSMHFHSADGRVERVPIFRLGDGRREHDGFVYPLQYVYGNHRDRVKEFRNGPELANAPLMTAERDEIVRQQEALGWQTEGTPNEKNEHLGWGNFDYQLTITLIPADGAGQDQARPPKALLEAFKKPM
ncbi:MAG: hypothetical protein ACLFTK_10840 [Anaerolineales bacterium]